MTLKFKVTKNITYQHFAKFVCELCKLKNTWKCCANLVNSSLKLTKVHNKCTCALLYAVTPFLIQSYAKSNGFCDANVHTQNPLILKLTLKLAYQIFLI